LLGGAPARATMDRVREPGAAARPVANVAEGRPSGTPSLAAFVARSTLWSSLALHRADRGRDAWEAARGAGGADRLRHGAQSVRGAARGATPLLDSRVDA